MGILGNGSSLVDSLVPSGLADVATRLVEAIAINSISEKVRRKRASVVKRRNIHSEQLAELTNLIFAWELCRVDNGCHFSPIRER